MKVNSVEETDSSATIVKDGVSASPKSGSQASLRSTQSTFLRSSSYEMENNDRMSLFYCFRHQLNHPEEKERRCSLCRMSKKDWCSVPLSVPLWEDLLLNSSLCRGSHLHLRLQDCREEGTGTSQPPHCCKQIGENLGRGWILDCYEKPVSDVCPLADCIQEGLNIGD